MQARALYDYVANPADSSELSFKKGDIFDIIDDSGKWWEAEAADGSTGIVPSSYLIIESASPNLKLVGAQGVQ